MREAEIDNYTSVYQYRKVPVSFSCPKDDAPVITRTYSVLESMESPTKVDALVLGVGGPKAVRKINNIFWESISNQNADNTLTIVDIRDFLEKDYLAISGEYSDRTFLQQADARNLPFEDNSFNLVLTHCFFPCLRDDNLKEVLEEIERVIVYGGFGIHTFRQTFFTGRAIRRLWSSLNSSRAGTVYFDRSINKMERMLNNNSFRIVSMRSKRGFASCENLTVGCIKTPKEEIGKYDEGLFLVQ